ncbi:MAG: hypothetical protein AAF927_25360 [Bacteroidota bacterium]
MSFESSQLDRMINQLESSLKRNRNSLFGTHYDESEWHQMHELIKEISAAFKSVRYATKADREQAWNHYAEVRNQVFEEQKSLKAANSSNKNCG